MAHTITDALLDNHVALPNAANTVNTNGIDLGAAVPYPLTEHVSVKIYTTAATAPANNKNINIRLMESADNITFTNVAEFANPILLVNEAATVYPASNVVVTLQPGCLRYIRATAIGEANGGDASDGDLHIAVNT